VATKLDRFNIVVLSDTHAGSKLALCNPDVVIQRSIVELDEQGINQLGFEDYRPPIEPVQELIWEKYISARDDFVEIAGSDPIFLLHLAEVCEGTYYTNSSMNLKKDEQVQIAVANMDPWKGLDNIEMVRILSGDRPHEFDEGSAGRMVASILKRDFKNVRAMPHSLLNINGFKIDYAHKGPYPGSRKWLKGNVARYYLIDYMMRELISFGRDPADLLLRGHYHEPIEERYAMSFQGGMHRSALMISPSMKFPDSHAKSVIQNRFAATIGLSMIEVVNNKILDFHHRHTTVDTRTWEVYDGE